MTSSWMLKRIAEGKRDLETTEVAQRGQKEIDPRERNVPKKVQQFSVRPQEP